MTTKFTRRAWAVVIHDGDRQPLVPWGCGNYWQLPIFHTRTEAKAWAKEHITAQFQKLVRVTVNGVVK